MGKWINTMNPFRSISTQLFYITFFSIFLFVMVTAFVSYSVSKSIIANQVADASLETVRQVNDKIHLKLKEFESVGLQVVTNEKLQGLLEQLQSSALNQDQRDQLRYQVYRILLLLQSVNGGIDLITLMPIDGNQQPISSYKNAKLDLDYAQREWFTQSIAAKGKPVWFPTSKKSYMGIDHPTFAMGRSIESANMSSGYMILVQFHHSALNDLLKGITLGESGSLQLIDAKNRVVQAQDVGQIGEEVSFDFSSSTNGKQTVAWQGIDTLLLDSASTKTGWRTIGQVPVEELTSQADQILIQTMWVAIGAVVAAILIGLIVIRLIGKPLEEMNQLFKRGEQGELNVRIHNKRSDEIGQLANRFNQMMEQLNRLVMQTNRSAQEVMETSKQVYGVSNSIRQSASDVSDSIHQVSVGASDLAEQAEYSNQITQRISKEIVSVVSSKEGMWMAAQQVQKSSSDGMITMKNLNEQTNRIEQVTVNLGDQVRTLRENTISIREVLILLNDLTKNINILAINAGIEATKAGVHGKGFMIVAMEMRRLADQSGDSIGRAESIINRIEMNIDNTAGTLDRATPMFRNQMESVKRTDEIFELVSKNMIDLVKRIDQVSQAISHLNVSSSELNAAMQSVTTVSGDTSATSDQVVTMSRGQLQVSQSIVDLSHRLEGLSSTLSDSLSRFKM